MKYISIFIFLLSSFAVSCQTTTKNYSEGFNTTIKNAEQSGNLTLAVNKVLKLKQSEVLANITTSSIATLTKSPTKHIGKFVKIKGLVFEVTEVDGLPGWAFIKISVENPNSVDRYTSMVCYYHGDIEKINPNTEVTVAGYFAGTYDGQNNYGGHVEGLTIVGNYCK